MISLKQIQYALSLDKHRHFRRAAETFSVTQSALSTGIAELEKELGFIVFERNNKSVLVTPIGREFLIKAKDVVQQVDDMLNMGKDQSSVLSYPLTIGLIPTVCPFVLPFVLPELESQYPEFELTVIEEQTQVLLQQVREGEIDSAVIALPFDTKGLLCFEFWQETLYWVMHQRDSHDFNDDEALTDSNSSRLMLLRDGHCLKDHALSVCQVSQNTLHSVNATSLDTLIQLVIGGQGITIVPEIALDHLIRPHPQLSIRPLADSGPHRRLAFVVRPNYTRLSSIEALAALFRNQLSARAPSQ